MGIVPQISPPNRVCKQGKVTSRQRRSRGRDTAKADTAGAGSPKTGMRRADGKCPAVHLPPLDRGPGAEVLLLSGDQRTPRWLAKLLQISTSYSH